MYLRFPEVTAYSQRHEVDLLEPYPGIDATEAQPPELPAMIALARAAVPGVVITTAAVERVYHQQPPCIFPFRCNGRIVGGIALLFLNENGLDRLLLDEMDFSDPDPAALITPGGTPAAIYLWAIATRGRAAAGIANVSVVMREEPYARADYYSLPTTMPGTRILVHLGFEPTNSFQSNLWTYRRLCNRIPAQPTAMPELAA